MILGAMRLYPGSLQFLKWTIPALRRITDRQLFLLCNGLQESQLAGIVPTDSTFVTSTKEVWGHQDTLNELFHATDLMQPEWVIYPDSDEILPVRRFPGIFDRCNREGMKGIAFAFAVPFGGFDYQLRLDQVPTGPHLKALRWEPNLNFHGTPGFCVPQGFWGKAIHSPEPLLHLYYMTEDARRQRHNQGRAEPFAPSPILIPAPSDWADLYYTI